MYDFFAKDMPHTLPLIITLWMAVASIQQYPFTPYFFIHLLFLEIMSGVAPDIYCCPEKIRDSRCCISETQLFPFFIHKSQLFQFLYQNFPSPSLFPSSPLPWWERARVRGKMISCFTLPFIPSHQGRGGDNL
jgi:hypothetical protein